MVHLSYCESYRTCNNDFFFLSEEMDFLIVQMLSTHCAVFLHRDIALFTEKEQILICLGRHGLQDLRLGPRKVGSCQNYKKRNVNSVFKGKSEVEIFETGLYWLQGNAHLF